MKASDKYEKAIKDIKGKDYNKKIINLENNYY